MQREHGVGIVPLRQVDQTPVVAEVDLTQLRVPVDPEAAEHQPVEAAHQEVGEVERARLVGLKFRERGRAGEQLVAVRTGQPLHAFLSAHHVQPSPGAAVRITNDRRRPGRLHGLHLGTHEVRDVVGGVVQRRREAAQAHVLTEAAARQQRGELGAERTTRDHHRWRRVGGDPVGDRRDRSGHDASARRCCTSWVAVSAATAASWQ